MVEATNFVFQESGRADKFKTIVPGREVERRGRWNEATGLFGPIEHLNGCGADGERWAAWRRYVAAPMNDGEPTARLDGSVLKVQQKGESW